MVRICGTLVASMLLVSCATDRSVPKAEAQVARWVDTLDSQTDDAGGYIRHESDEIMETDPWGTYLRVSYKKGGFAETVAVRSYGPDKLGFTGDDIVLERSKVNIRGVGSGVRDNLEEAAANTARGLVKGVVEGVREAISTPRDDRAIEDDSVTTSPQNDQER